MSGFSKFRTSLGGFNRTDVSDYMTKICAEHQSVLKQQQAESALLEQKLAEADRSLTDALSRLDRAEKAAAEKDAEILALRGELEAAEALLASQPAPQEEPVPDYAAMELEAYRRAEATERMAAERSARLRQQLSDLLDGTAQQYEEAGQEITALAEDIRANLKRLEEALSDLDTVFDDTAERLRTLDEAETD